MKIALIALGTRGDVQPYVALSHGLAQRGHGVTLITTENFRPLCENLNIAFVPLPGDVEAFMRSVEISRLMDRGAFLQIQKRAMAETRRLIVDWLRICAHVTRGHDLIMAGLGAAFLARAIQESFGTPLTFAPLVPFAATSEFEGILTPSIPFAWHPILRRLSHIIGRRAFWLSMRDAVNLARHEALALKPLGFSDPFVALDKGPSPVLFGYSSHLIPRPNDWRSHISVTGYWFLDEPMGWNPPPELASFLSAGEPPVCMGFGSMSSGQSTNFLDLIREGVARTGKRVLVLTGWGGVDSAPTDNRILVLKSVPHAWLFPRCAAIIHHGGAGTTAAVLRAGKPSWIAPVFADQPFWGRTIHRAGVGLRPVPRRHLDVSNLTQALTKLTSDRQLNARARELGEKIRSEDGIENAVRALGL